MMLQLRSLWARYAGGRTGVAAFGTGARVFALGSQVVVLIVMSRLLPKTEFGDAMIVFTLYRLISLALGSGLGSVVLYHVARSGGDRALDVRLMRTVASVCALVGVLLAFAAVLAAPTIAEFFDKPGLTPWLINLAPILPFGALIQTSASSFDGRSAITRSIVLTELAPNLIRLLGLSAVGVLGLSSPTIALVLWIAVAIPWLIDLWRLGSSAVAGFEPLTFRDGKYAVWMGVYPLAGQQLQGIDMILVATFFSSEIAAEYSIASRLASFYPFLQQIVVRIATPQSGALLQGEAYDKLNDQLRDLRENSLFLTAVLAGLIIIAAPVITRISGDYSGVLPIMVALAIPPLIRSMFAGIDIVLRMRGHGGSIAAIALSSAMVLCGGTWALQGALGIYALPFSMAVSAIAINAIAARRIGAWGVRVAGYADFAIVIAVVILLVLAATFLPSVQAALASGLCLITLAGLARLKARRATEIRTVP